MRGTGEFIVEQWTSAAGESDELRLVHSVLAGDRPAFDELVQRHAAHVTAAARRFLRDPNDLEDVVQETFPRAYQNMRRFRGESHLRTWLIQIALNVCRDRQRGFWKRRVVLAVDWKGATCPTGESFSDGVTGGNIIGAAVLGYVWPEQATLAELSAAIQKSTGLEVLADSFISARLDPALIRARQPLRQVLDTVATELDYTWEKRGRLLLFRNRRFYRDRPAEVPSRIIAAFRGTVLRDKSLSLDALGRLAATLTDPQVRSMHRYWGWYLEDPTIMPVASLFPRRAHFRFWNSLSEAQKAAAQTETGLPVAQMLPGQQALWLAGLHAPSVSSRSPANAMRVSTPDQLAGGKFRVRAYPAQMVAFIRPVDEGKRQVGSSVVVEGPPSQNPLDFVRTEDGGKPEGAGPQVSLNGFQFHYYVGGRKEPALRESILLAPLQPARPKRALN